MIRWLVGTSVRLRFLVIIIAAAITFFGLSQLRSTSVDVIPEFLLPFVEVQTEALGLSAEEVEALITVPIEADLLAGVAFLQSISSESVNGLSSILLVFEPGTDLFRARQMVQERLTQAHALPNVSKPPVMVQPLSSASRVMMVGLSSEELSLIELSVLARWNIVPRLTGVDGVANVSIFGQRKRQLQVQVDPVELQAEGVSLMQIISTTGNALWVSPLSFLNASTPGTGGWIDTPNQRLPIQHLSPISTPEDLARVNIEGTSLLLSDVARVVEDHQPLIGDAIINNETGLLLVVEKFPWANTLDVTAGVDSALAAMRPGLAGVNLDASLFRPANYVERSVDNLSRSLLIGLIVLIVALFTLFSNWRTGLIATVVIPVSLIVSLFILDLRGAPINALVVAGLMIALAVVVDNAVVDMDNIMRRLRQRRREGDSNSTARIVLEASTEMRSPLLYGTMIVVLSVVPILLLQGTEGLFFRPFAVTYVLAVVASLVVALTVTPALSMILLGNATIEPREPVMARWLHAGFDSRLARTFRTPVTALVVTSILVVAGVVVLTQLEQGSVIPVFKDTDLLIEWSAAPGTSHPEMSRIAAQTSRALRTIPGVTNVSAHVGRAVLSDQVVSINSGQMWINIDPTAQYDATIASVNEVLGGFPGLSIETTTFLNESAGQLKSEANDGIVVRLFGPQLDVLGSKAQEIATSLSGVEGVIGTRVEAFDQEPTVQVQVDIAAAQQVGLKPGDVRRAAAVLLSGIEVGSLYEQSKIFEVVVLGTPEIRSSMTSINELLIDTPDGGQVRLEEVADVRIAPLPIVIERSGVSRRIDIEVIVAGRNLGAVASDIERRLDRIDFDLEYHPEVLGGFELQGVARSSRLLIALAALIGIFLLQQSAVRSWRLAVMAFLALPVALAGGLLAAYLGSDALSLGSYLGLLAVLGLTTHQGILLITHFRNLELREGESFGLELVQRGTRDRLVPILTTTLATGLAMMPVLFAGNIAGLEILHPLALVMVGGLVTGALVNLVVLPAMYLQLWVRPEEDFDFGSAPEMGTASVMGGP